MRVQHKRTIQRLVTRFRHAPRYPALIIGESTAKGWASGDSDVDILLIPTDFTRQAEWNWRDGYPPCRTGKL
ncbi:MAG TPA: hypothetical protein VH591_14305 [Ktedonobacterales bacterium]|jgi:hypothetical protein